MERLAQPTSYERAVALQDCGTIFPLPDWALDTRLERFRREHRGKPVGMDRATRAFVRLIDVVAVQEA